MKIGFVGAGRIGSTTAFSALHSLDITELVLLDIKCNLAQGEALDLEHAANVLGKNVKVTSTCNYSDLEGALITVISAGKARTADMDRRNLLSENVHIVSETAKRVAEANPNGMILQVTNPVDILTYIAYKQSGLERNKVFGMSGVLDTARLQALGFEGMILGHHGEKMVPTTRLNHEDLEKVRYASLPVITLKGSTHYAPAAAIAKMLNAITRNTKEVMPCSCILDGEYGLSGLALGVPAMIGSKGIEKIIEFELDSEQEKMLSESAAFIKNIIQGLNS
ncbi:malate dehydrogenase [archaeon]|nr:malate dehydrogenase [archaeon]